MKKVLIYGYYIFNNLGDNYMMYYVNELLKKNNITPYYFEQIDDSYFIINNVKRYSFPGYKKFSNKFIKLIELLKWYFISNHSDEFDALIFIGGGYTNEDFGLLRMIYMYLLINRFKKNNKKIYFTGQTVGPVNTFIGKYLLREIYSNADFIAVRERTSYEYLKNINIDNHLVGDDAFLSFEEYDSHLKKNPTTILCFKYFKGYEKFKKYFFDFCLDIAKKSKDYILIIPFRSLEKEPEYKVNYELYEYLKVNNINVDFVVERDINIFIDLFKSSHRIISTAYHALVIGLIFGNEVYSAYLGDYYKIKIEGILNFYNICNQSIDFQMLKENENIMNNIFDDYYSFNEINEKSIEIAKNVKSLWSNIINEINSQ